jgi:hypothetical protein
VKQELIDELADHIQRPLIVGELLEVPEDEHHSVFEGIDRVDVLLILRLNFKK